MANVVHAQKYNIVTKNGRNRPENWLKSIVRVLECQDVACQVLPHLVLLIPMLEEWEQTRIAGKGDKTQYSFLYVLSIPKGLKPARFYEYAPDFGLDNL